MLEKLDVFRLALGMAQHAGARQEAISRNVANADTPGYRATDVAPFEQTFHETEGAAAMRHTRPGHLAGSATGDAAFTAIDAPDSASPNGNTVSLEDQMLKAADVRHQHELALTVYQNTLGILRTSLGRR